MRQHRQRLWNLFLGFSLLLCLAVPVTVLAASSPTDKASDSTTSQAVTQGYSTDTPLQYGMIVRLKPGNASKVVPLTNADGPQMLGVVVSPNAAALTLSSDSNSGQVYVASFGTYDALVSNQNGPIKAGDYIAISALAGVGMKSDTNQSVVLGRAKAAFSGTGLVAGTAKLKDTTGKSVQVSIGRIPIDISISHNPLQSSTAGTTGFVQHVGQTVAGRPIGVIRAYLAMIILLGTVVVATVVLYSGVRGGLVAIGRNPLGKRAIYSGIVRVMLAGLMIFIAGVGGVYLLLKL